MFERISSDPAILNGKPCVREHASVSLLELAGSGASRDEIVRQYNQLQPEDVEQAFRYAGRALQSDVTIALEGAR